MTESVRGDQSLEPGGVAVAETTLTATQANGTHRRASDNTPYFPDTESAVTVMTVLAHKLRIEIWCTLIPHGSSGLTAGAIAAQLHVAPSSLSFHLNQMARVGALVMRQNGRHNIYSAHTELVAAL